VREFSAGITDVTQFAEVDRWATIDLGEAPALIVACLDTDKMPLEMAGSSLWPAVQNILLAAAALGYGSLMANLPIYTGEVLGTLLGLPSHVVAQATVPLGRPARALGPPRRDPFSDHTHRDRFGTHW
jgi:nitroreductase